MRAQQNPLVLTSLRALVDAGFWTVPARMPNGTSQPKKNWAQ